MYTIELDVDPVTLGFDSKEVSRKEDGIYVVTKKFFRVYVWDPSDSNIGGRAWCPCSYEIVNEANWSGGGSYSIDGGSEHSYGRNSVIDYLTAHGLSGRYGVPFSKEDESNVGKTCALVCGHAPSRQRFYGDYIKQGYKCRLGTPPSDPYHDPFLPDKFKQMLGNSYVGDGNA